MKIRPGGWKLRGLLLLAVLYLAGCQSINLSPTGGFVSSEARIALPEGRQSDTWQTRELSVNYTSSRNGNELNVEGVIRFTSMMTNTYSNLHEFQLGIVCLDEGGKVLESKGLISSARENFSPLPFKKTLTLPAGTRSMAFTFRGTASQSDEGGGDTSSIWHYPIRR